ncbi:unnamed protein product [Euphydryas editha]|uniref:Uncharacterized protein n=1 Tax=Euphydryas editha TaxID=104508 RepID=A0AAU9V2K1_EUPED|nr:unnamed protein product [Euphydryas editha]
MSVQRSPTGSGTNTRPCGSQLKYTEIQTNESSTNITHRNKRKEPNDSVRICSELSDLKKQMSEIMEMIKLTSSSQAENINKLSNDISTIKNQVSDISSTIVNILSEQNNMKITVNNLQNANENLRKKIDVLESDINKIKDTLPISTSDGQPRPTYEEIVSEINERYIRSKNIVIVGVPEPDMTTDRHIYDKNEVGKILKMINPECPEPLKTHRLGKLKPDYIRPLKVYFSTDETAKVLLRNKHTVNLNNIKIFSDQTPNQRRYIQNLKKELEKRTADGEINLTIKYIKDIPKIIKSTNEKGKENIPMAKN